MDSAAGAQAIDQTKLGDRVGPEDASCADPELAAWREVDRQMTVRDHGERDEVELRLIRPAA